MVMKCSPCSARIYPQKNVVMNLDTRQPFKLVQKEKVGMNLVKYTRIFPRWFQNVPQEKYFRQASRRMT